MGCTVQGVDGALLPSTGLGQAKRDPQVYLYPDGVRGAGMRLESQDGGGGTQPRGGWQGLASREPAALLAEPRGEPVSPVSPPPDRAPLWARHLGSCSAMLRGRKVDSRNRGALATSSRLGPCSSPIPDSGHKEQTASCPLEGHEGHRAGSWAQAFPLGVPQSRRGSRPPLGVYRQAQRRGV